ncbi:hypothetical protein [Tropicimonas marinistellae]|uniref:hypothetical protein n=1 Tax=Tropicimonas marinistellae TaxID=1739787 RepID=UPI00083602F1|nr:hypothetical protein [Tropicimonas marinistellae]
MSLILRLLFGAAVISAWTLAAQADLVSPYGGETAPNFVEISVLEDRVRVALEIDPADYPHFVAPDDGTGQSLAARTGGTMRVAADGQPLAAVIRSVDLRPRKARITAATSVVQPRPRSDEVIYAELEFPFAGQPSRMTFTPPLDETGMPTASLGVLVEHLGVPVTDYRYLSQAEVLVPDWNDPWFSRFENPNLTRHHKSPLMSFLSMEPREVRHEIIVRLRDLETWVDLGLGESETVGGAQMGVVASGAEAFFADRNPVTVDGQRVAPSDIRISRIAVGVEGLRVLDDAQDVDRATALLGVVMSYPRPALARDVEMTWELFPDGVETVPVTLTDPAGGVPAQVRAGDPVVRWTNHLTTWEEPQSRPVTVSTARVVDLPLVAMVLGLGAAAAAWVAVRGRGPRRVLAIAGAVACVGAAALTAPLSTRIPLPGRPAPDADAAHLLMAGLLDNMGAAMLETRPDGFAQALAPFVLSGRTGDVGAELRRGLSVSLPSGALARTDEIVEIEVERISPVPDATGNQIVAQWTASVSGGHWGHLHRRQVTYRGLVDVTREADRWFLSGLTILSAQSRT